MDSKAVKIPAPQEHIDRHKDGDAFQALVEGAVAWAVRALDTQMGPTLRITYNVLLKTDAKKTSKYRLISDCPDVEDWIGGPVSTNDPEYVMGELVSQVKGVFKAKKWHVNNSVQYTNVFTISTHDDCTG